MDPQLEEYEQLDRFGVKQQLHKIREEKANILRKRTLEKERTQLKQLQKSPQQIAKEEREKRLREESKAIRKGTIKRVARFGKFLASEGIRVVDKGIKFRQSPSRINQKQYVNSEQGSPLGGVSLSGSVRDNSLLVDRIENKDFYGSHEERTILDDTKHKSNLDNLI